MEFIQKYARVAGSDDDGDDDNMEDDVTTSEVGNISDKNFIDDMETKAWDHNDLTSYGLANVTRSLQEALQHYSMSKDLGVCSDPENFVPNQLDTFEYDYDEFKWFEKRIEKFMQELQFFRQDSKESLYFAVFYCTYYNLLEKKESFEFCEDENVLKNVLEGEFFNEFVKNAILFLLTETCWQFSNSVKF